MLECARPSRWPSVVIPSVSSTTAAMPLSPWSPKTIAQAIAEPRGPARRYDAANRLAKLIDIAGLKPRKLRAKVNAQLVSRIERQQHSGVVLKQNRFGLSQPRDVFETGRLDPSGNVRTLDSLS